MQAILYAIISPHSISGMIWPIHVSFCSDNMEAFIISLCCSNIHAIWVRDQPHRKEHCHNKSKHKCVDSNPW